MIARSEKIRVLIVDDSFFMKKLLTELLLADKMIDVVGQAKDGNQAVELAQQLKPDVITMDYNMPGLNGVDTIKKILADPETHEPSIIMISAYTEEGSEEAMEALRAGAIDFIKKPSGELSLDIDKITDVILEKIHIASRARIRRYGRLKRVTKKQPKPHHAAGNIVVIGSSTGGPPVVEDIIVALPEAPHAAIIIAQHMPQFFTKKFADRLNGLTHMWVKHAEDGDILKDGQVFVAPADMQLFFVDKGDQVIIKLTDLSEDYPGPRPSINQIMTSAAQTYGDHTLGIILTGMGQDGYEGIKAIRESGGIAIAQDPHTATIPSMPETIIHAGLANKVLSPHDMSNYLNTHIV